MSDLYFVYGTLKQGYGNNHLLQSSDFLGLARSVLPRYKMSCVGFPYLYHVGPGNFYVKGEVYLVDDVRVKHRLDGLEGYPSHYTREVHKFLLDGTDEVDAWVYLHPNPARAATALNKVEPTDDTLEWKGRNYASRY